MFLFSQEHFANLLAEDPKAFASTVTEHDIRVAVSRKPIEIEGAKFRVTMYFQNDVLIEVSLVAVDKQNDQRYAGKDQNTVHQKWMRKNFGEPTEVTQYGCKYRRPDAIVVSEHDSGKATDIIIFRFCEN